LTPGSGDGYNDNVAGYHLQVVAGGKIMPLHLCQEVAVKATLRTHDDLARAARAVPENRRLWQAGGVSQNTLRIVTHCATANLLLAAAFTGQPVPYLTQEEREKAIAACDTLDKAEAFLNRSVTAVCDAIVSLPESHLSELIIMPWGERMPVALSLLSPSYHMQYHEGQINYIQTLLGDDEFH
jgi:uncharacterized damage-inducible protein DinB